MRPCFEGRVPVRLLLWSGLLILTLVELDTKCQLQSFTFLGGETSCPPIIVKAECQLRHQESIVQFQAKGRAHSDPFGYFYLFIYFDRQPSIRLTLSEDICLVFKKNANKPSLLIHQFFRRRIYSTFNRAGGFYHRYSRPDIDRPLNKEKREITADLSLPPCQPLNHPPSGEKPESSMTTADSLSVSPLWLYEVHIAKNTSSGTAGGTVCQWLQTNTVKADLVFVRPGRNDLKLCSWKGMCLFIGKAHLNIHYIFKSFPLSCLSGQSLNTFYLLAAIDFYCPRGGWNGLSWTLECCTRFANSTGESITAGAQRQSHSTVNTHQKNGSVSSSEDETRIVHFIVHFVKKKKNNEKLSLLVIVHTLLEYLKQQPKTKHPHSSACQIPQMHRSPHLSTPFLKDPLLFWIIQRLTERLWKNSTIWPAVILSQNVQQSYMLTLLLECLLWSSTTCFFVS